ncbi:hypothetical protein CEXT_360591 [Caerostris extrusa]|uniref:Uncharacterized protein n=1 Tax=Caerostris extrusa TaxID=172846 RepID=A0AAV4NLE7_CAEEX|nr:hypothetical protein CEXT_360591 [Caerostris extrusa]
MFDNALQHWAPPIGSNFSFEVSKEKQQKRAKKPVEVDKKGIKENSKFGSMSKVITEIASSAFDRPLLPV